MSHLTDEQEAALAILEHSSSLLTGRETDLCQKVAEGKPLTSEASGHETADCHVWKSLKNQFSREIGIGRTRPIH